MPPPTAPPSPLTIVSSPSGTATPSATLAAAQVASAARAIEERLIADTGSTCFRGAGDSIRSAPNPNQLQAIDQLIDTEGEGIFIGGGLFPPGVAFVGTVEAAAQAFGARVLFRDAAGDIWLEAPDPQGDLRGVQLYEITTPKGRTVWVGNNYMSPFPCPPAPGP